jgi:hypothetical protein
MRVAENTKGARLPRCPVQFTTILPNKVTVLNSATSRVRVPVRGARVYHQQICRSSNDFRLARDKHLK